MWMLSESQALRLPEDQVRYSPSDPLTTRSLQGTRRVGPHDSSRPDPEMGSRLVEELRQLTLGVGALVDRWEASDEGSRSGASAEADPHPQRKTRSRDVVA